MSRPDYSGMFWDQRLAHWAMRPFAASALHPNHVTAIGLLAGLAACVLYGIGGRASYWGGALFMFSVLADHADGELARMSGRTSTFGHHLDLIVDGIVKVALFIGMGAGLSTSDLGEWTLPMGISAGLSVGVVILLRFDIERRLGGDEVEQPTWAGFEIEDIMYLLGPITWLGGLVPFLAAASVGAPLFLIWQLWDARRTARDEKVK